MLIPYIRENLIEEIKRMVLDSYRIVSINIMLSSLRINYTGSVGKSISKNQTNMDYSTKMAKNMASLA